MALSGKQMTFCQEFVKTRKLAKSAEIAFGYTTWKRAKERASKEMANPEIKEYIAYLEDQILLDTESIKKAVYKFWWDTMTDEKVAMTHRTKCSEYIAKAESMFETNINVSSDTIEVNITGEDDG